MNDRRRLAPLDPQHPDNRGVLAYLSRNDPTTPPIARPSSHADPYLGCGSHPDVVERVWDELGKVLPRASRALVHEKPALVHASAGVVLAAALGTQYALRIPPDFRAEAEEAGLATSHRFGTAGVTLDLASFGPAWRFGAWDGREAEWLAAEHARLG